MGIFDWLFPDPKDPNEEKLKIAEEKNIRVEDVDKYLEFEKYLDKAQEFYRQVSHDYKSCIENALVVFDSQDNYNYEYKKTATWQEQFNRAAKLLENVSLECCELGQQNYDRAKKEYEEDFVELSEVQYYLNQAIDYFTLAQESKCGNQREIYDILFDCDNLKENAEKKSDGTYYNEKYRNIAIDYLNDAEIYLAKNYIGHEYQYKMNYANNYIYKADNGYGEVDDLIDRYNNCRTREKEIEIENRKQDDREF